MVGCMVVSKFVHRGVLNGTKDFRTVATAAGAELDDEDIAGLEESLGGVENIEQFAKRVGVYLERRYGPPNTTLK